MNRIIRKKKENRNGFTLIEVLIAMAIFTVIIGGVALFSVRSVQSHSRSRVMRNSLENVRFAIENLSKKLRTTYYVSAEDDGRAIFFIDNVDFSKNCYEFVELGGRKILQTKKEEKPASRNDSGYESWRSIDSCAGIIGPAQPVIASEKTNIVGRFDVKQTDFESDPDRPKQGFVRIAVTVQYVARRSLADDDFMGINPVDKDEATIQSGVSLRDYPVPGLEVSDMLPE